MKFLAYAVYDTGTEFFSPPFFVRAPGEALRSFTMFVNDPKQRHLAPAVALYCIGSYDDNTGQLASDGVPTTFLSGTEVLTDVSRETGS